MTVNKPKLGVVFFAARWFEEVVLGNSKSAQKFDSFMREDTTRIIDGLGDECTTIKCPVVSSMTRAREVVQMLQRENVDAILLVFVVWSEDEYLLPFRDIMRIMPTILWIYTPYKRAPEKMDVMTLYRNSGIVASFEATGVLKMINVQPFFVVGSVLDEAPFLRIKQIARAAHVLRELRSVRLGILPYRNEQMIVTYVDEFRLYSQIGPAVDYISVLQLKKASDSIPEHAVDQYVSTIRSNYRVDGKVSDEDLTRSARVSLGMEKILEDRQIDGLALSDLNPELHEVMGLRPCLYPESLAQSSRVVGNEGDLGCTTAMIMLQRLTKKPVMFTEIFNYDYRDNTIVAGHAGPANFLLAEDSSGITITPDYELMDAAQRSWGVWMEFIGKSGRVTIVNFICKPDGFQFTLLGGESLGGKQRIVGYPHFYIKIDTQIDDFISSNADSGVSHHWAIVHGDVEEEIAALARMLQVKCITLTGGSTGR